MPLTPDIKSHKKLNQWSKYLAITIIIIASLVLVGWGFNIEFLKRPIRNLVAMNPASGVLFILLGLSFLLYTSKKSTNQKNIAAKILAGAVLLVGFLRIVGIIINYDLPVDQFLFFQKLKTDLIGNVSNRMAPNTAFCFMLAGVSLLLLRFETRRKRRVLSHLFALVISSLAFFAIIGYLYRVEAFFGVLVYIPMAIHTATCFLCFSIAILFTNPDKGIMKEFTGSYTGSIIARMLIPAAIIIPLIFGLLRLWAAWSGILPFEMGTAFLVLSIIIVFICLIWYNAALLNKRDEKSKQAAMALRESEEQTQTIFNSAPDAVIMIGQDGTVVKWNPKAEELFGWKANEIIGLMLSETIIPHRYREAHKKGLNHFLQTGEGPVLNKSIEIHALNKDNVEFDIALSISPTIVNGKYLFIGFIRDITDRKLAEEQIQKQKLEIQDFIDSMSTLSAKLSTDGKILMVNKIAMQASGLSMEELLKTNFTEGQWWTFDPEVHSRVRDAFKKACSGTPVNYDENIFAFGQVLTINFSLIPILKSDGNVDYIVAEGRDVTAQKNAEEKIKESEHMFSTLFYKSPIMKAIAEASTGKYLDVNDSLADFFGRTKEEIVGKTSVELNMLVHPEQREGIVNNLKQYGFARDVETKITSKNGKSRWVSTSIDAINLNGKDCFLTAAIDITKRKEAEEKIKDSEEKLSMLFNSIDEGFCIIEMIFDEKRKPTDYRFLVVNPSFEKQTGLRDAAGKRMREFAPNHEEHWFEIYGRIALTGESIRFENRAEQLHRWYDVYAFRFGDPKNLQVAILFNDITDRKKTEETIRKLNQELEKRVEEKTRETIQTEKRFRKLIENSTDIISLTDGNFKTIYRSPSAERITGWTNEEREKLGVANLFHLDDLPIVQKAMKEILKTPHKPLHVTYRHRHKDGHYIWLDGMMTNMFQDETIKAILFNLRDITENKKVEESLRKTVKEISDYKYALDESSIVAITDQKGIIKYANRNFCKISKYSVDELIGQDHRIINSGYHSKEFIRNLWVTIANGKIWKGELKNKAKDGTIYWVDTTIVPFLNEDGKPYQYVAIRADITERKQAEQALKESQQLLSAIIDNSTAVIYIKNLKGQYLMVNRQFTELFHLSGEDIIGKTDYDFLSKEVADAVRQMDIRAAGSDHAVTEEEIVPLDDGPHTYISVKSILRDSTGKPYATFGISTDITERKKVEEAILRAEANYREIFENATDAIYVHEMNTGKVIEVNQRAAEVTGYTKEELLNGDLNDAITGHPDYTLEKAIDYIKDAATGKQQLFEWLGKKKDGSFNWFEVNLKKANIGGEERILAFFREINDRKKVQLEIQKLNEGLEQKVTERTAQLEAVNKELEAFSYSVSHDLRAPLRIIDGYTEMLVTDYKNTLEEEGQRMFGIITANVRKMGQLIDDLLNLSQTGRKELIVYPSDMNRLVKSAIEEQLSLNSEKPVEIKMENLESAECDSGLLRQVWVNLISNAIKYSGKQEHPLIRISSSKQNGEIIYEIRDNGVGFDMKYSGQLFGVFQRLHKATEFEGTGVGLALVKRIVAKHGGRVWAESKVGKGATFFFSLPFGKQLS